MNDLRHERVWAVWSGPKKQFVSASNGAPAVANDPSTLVTWAEAADCMNRLADGKWPVHYSIALSLDAPGVLAISLLNCWSEEKGIKEGAALWADMIGSYTEVCHPSLDGTSLRILVRGKLPPAPRFPSTVLIQERGFVTLTCQRISPRPAWREDQGGTIVDATEALALLCGERKPQFINM